MEQDKDLPVVITRPLMQASALADRIAASGRRAVVFPLLEIQALPEHARIREVLGRLADFALVAFVSPNAIDAAFALQPDWPPQVALAVVGEGSKATLARHGRTPENSSVFSPRDRERSDSETLLEALDLEALRGRKVLIVRGESGRELLADRLRDQGVQVEQLAVYRRSAPVLDEVRRTQLLKLIDHGAQWLITSSEALRILVDLAHRHGGQAVVVKLQQQQLIIPHARIVETAQALGFNCVLRTASGDEQLLAALQFRP